MLSLETEGKLLNSDLSYGILIDNACKNSKLYRLTNDWRKILQMKNKIDHIKSKEELGESLWEIKTLK